MASTDDKQALAMSAGCAMFFAALPASAIWYVLLGILLNKTDSGAMEWSLFVGYVVCSVLALVLGTLFRAASSI
jgi:hypothetical protein